MLARLIVEKRGDIQVAVTWAFADAASARRGRKNMIIEIEGFWFRSKVK